jgi:hypothetical protein
VQEREAEFRSVFADVFGVSPRIRCVARDGAPVDVVEVADTDEPAMTKEDALERLKREFGGVLEPGFGEGRES